MNSLTKNSLEVLMSDSNVLNKHVFNSTISDVIIQSKVEPETELQKEHINEIQNTLWIGYCLNMIRFDLDRHKRLCETLDDSSQSKERRYYVSTEKRRMFKRLMCLKRLENTASSTSDIASALHISHKAASDIIKDSIGFDTVEQTTVHNRKRYCAKNWWVNTFMRNGARYAFLNGENLVRSRWLYSEYSKACISGSIGTKV
jgi:hypothetical protein